MTQRCAVHATFILERTYPHAPARVFKAFADEQAKAKWFSGPDGFETHERQFDFRVGGQEVLVGKHGASHDNMVSAFHSVYQDIVPDQRIVYSYRMAGRCSHLGVASHHRDTARGNGRQADPDRIRRLSGRL